MKTPRLAIVRGAFLNRFEMQQFERLIPRYAITAFSSLRPIHATFAFPLVRLPSPVDIPSFPYKMPLLNRLCVDAQYLVGLEAKLRGYDIAHTAETYYHYTQQCLNAKQRGYVRRVVVTVWETRPHANEGIWGRVRFKERARCEADHFIAATMRAKHALIAEGVASDRISVIGPHIDTERFRPGRTDHHGMTVLFCGRLEKEKGILTLTDALGILAQNRTLSTLPVRIRIVGKGSLQRVITEKLTRFPPNWRATIEHAEYGDMPAIYRSADIFVAPSLPTPTWEEQFGMTLMEAQASGLPIITTQSGGIPENVGNAAIVVKPGDTEAIAQALTDLLLHPQKRRALSIRARRRAVAVHDISHGARMLDALYRSLL